jgi:unsaturated chondroitin disaccharide hydrolase
MDQPQNAFQTAAAGALDFAWDTIRRTIPRMGTEHPRIGRDDLTYERCARDDWVEGFWAGQLWLAYDHTRDPVFLDAAQAQRPYFMERLNRPQSHDHDLGFLYTLSLVADYKITGCQEARDGALRAADSLIARYHPIGRFIRAWNDWPGVNNQGRIIIDCMENLPLLYWASRETGASRYADIANVHAYTNTHYIVRYDGSTYHTYFFDPASGRPQRGATFQGYADESCWSRGQAWGVHGYSVAYRYTGDSLYAATARRLADYALAHLPEDGVPYYDYRLPEDVPHYRDTSAAAILAAGLLNLADVIADGAVYHEAACRLLLRLIEGYTTAGAPAAEGLLREGASHVAAGKASQMLPYGDYFFVEALLRSLGHSAFAW